MLDSAASTVAYFDYSVRDSGMRRKPSTTKEGEPSEGLEFGRAPKRRSRAGSEVLREFVVQVEHSGAVADLDKDGKDFYYYEIDADLVDAVVEVIKEVYTVGHTT